jgi:anaerobic carbon-monoxide dehydrogenase iron sulfur subunit
MENPICEKIVGESSVRIKWDNSACYGCRVCELMCSFHHNETFSPAGGSIAVWKNNGNGKISWVRDSSCDNCDGEDTALCVKYCPYGALSIHEE